MKSSLVILLVLTLVSYAPQAARADAYTDLINQMNKQKRTPSPLLTQIAPSTAQSIRETAHIINAWNPETNEAAVQNILTKRVQYMGVKDGLTKPAIRLMDAAIFVDKPEVAKALLPSITREFPLTGKKLLDALGFHSADLLALAASPNDLQSLKDETLRLIQQKYGPNARASVQMPDLVRDWNNADPTGLSTAIYGPGSYLHSAAGAGLLPDDTQSPIMGMPGDDSCGMVNPDRDPDNGPSGTPSDTQRVPKFRQTRDSLPAWQNNALAPYVNPVRSDDFASRLGIARPAMNFRTLQSARGLK